MLFNSWGFCHSTWWALEISPYIIWTFDNAIVALFSLQKTVVYGSQNPLELVELICIDMSKTYVSCFLHEVIAEYPRTVFRCASISWFQVVSQSVIHLFLQLVQLRVSQIIYLGSPVTSWDQRWHLWSRLLEATWACILFLTQTCLLFSANLEKNVNFAIIISLLLWLYTTFQLGETGFCLTASDPKVYFNHKQNHNERLSVFCGRTRMLRGRDM